MTLLKPTVNFLSFLNKFRDVDRKFFATELNRMENDVEHSYQLAMTAWFLVEKSDLDLDIAKVIRYALVHDLVEVFAGDTPFMDKSHITKPKRESDALNKIKRLFGNDFEQLHSTIEQYEKRDDEESLFINALDKTIPMINGYMDNGRTWHKLYYDMNLEQAVKIKLEASKQNKTIEILSNEVLEVLLKDSDFYFGKGKRSQQNNYAFIDGQNLYKGVNDLSWDLDYKKLRHYLSAKYSVKKAFIYLGYIKSNKKLYEYLEEVGFSLVFKEVTTNSIGKTKGNVDILLAVDVLKKIDAFDKAVIITSDGDFTPLIEDLLLRDSLKSVISPVKKKCSHLLQKGARGYMRFLDDVQHKVCQIKKRSAD